jgi:hypothetical protein
MDLILSLKKYIENYKLAFSYSILFIFLLFIIDPLITIFGGTLNLSYSIVNTHFVNLILILITTFVLMFIYSLIQSVLIYKIGKEYSISEIVPFKKVKKLFYKLLKFNFIFFLLLFLISSIFYDLNILNNVIVQIIFLIISVFLWFVPQIIILENETISKSILLSIKYFQRNWFHFLTLFLSAFILILITSLLDILIPGVAGIVVSTGFLVIFVIPYIEILKTEIYLNKYNLLKPRHQLR